MLVLGFKILDAVMVGDVKVTVIRDGKSIKLGFEGPRETKIVRCELLERKESNENLRIQGD